MQAEDEQSVQVASVKIALQLKEDSHPLAMSKSLSNLLAAQVIAVQVVEEVHTVQVAPATEIALQLYDDSQPLAITESLLYFPVEQAIALQVDGLVEAHKVQVALFGTEITLQLVQVVTSSSSFSTAPPKVPAVHFKQELATENGLKKGFDMNEPAGQHPYFALLVPSSLNALRSPLRFSHAPPHNVRVNPLL